MPKTKEPLSLAKTSTGFRVADYAQAIADYASEGTLSAGARMDSTGRLARFIKRQGLRLRNSGQNIDQWLESQSKPLLAQ